MKKNNKIIINCSTEQKEKIKKQADKIGLTLQEYALKVLLNTQVEIRIQSR
jgi:predicted DNA binding CopG/RHH family protein